MKIGELSRKTGIPVGTLRFYENENLIQSGRTPSGYRDFPEESLIVARRIRAYRSLNLSLPEVRRLLELSETPVQACAEVCQMMDAHLQGVLKQKELLLEVETELRRLLAICPGPLAPAEGCRILHELNPELT